MFVFSMTGH